MSDRLAALRLFARVARTGSFSAAGREMGLSQPSASRILANLEDEVGVVLLARSTRAVTLTDAGKLYLERIDPILLAIDDADHAVRGNGELSGQLRVGASISFAAREVIPRLGHFLESHPRLRIAFVFSDHLQDLISDSIDVALRFGTLEDSSAVARLIGTPRRFLAASPAYLNRFGAPKSPADLASHSIIMGPSGFSREAWVFQRDGQTMTVRVEGRITVSVNEAATAAALAHLGIISTGLWGCRADIESGRLVEVLPDWEMGSKAVHAIYPPGQPIKPSARALIDFLVEELN
ncbi:LysR family transcriptional regulator [Pseudomonas sp. RC10]|uniref:LysR family transcriptional regulator n=1 Tax=Pseudomonas bambusae TaxID=3139142 RepID=UPI00313A4A4F